MSYPGTLKNTMPRALTWSSITSLTYPGVALVQELGADTLPRTGSVRWPAGHLEAPVPSSVVEETLSTEWLPMEQAQGTELAFG